MATIMTITLSQTAAITPPPVSVLGIDLKTLSAKENEALQRMREEFKGIEYAERDVAESTFALNDYTYLKYLRARDFDEDKAKQILHKTIAWRNKIVPATITATQPGVRIVAEMMGRSKLGCPIFYWEMGRFEPGEYSFDNYVASRVFELEEMHRQLAYDGWKVDKFVLFCNLQDFRFLKHASPHALRLQQAFIEMLQSLYRDSVHTIILTHTGGAFQRLWSLCKHWLRPETAKKVLMVKDLAEIQDLIDPSNLYEHFGGTKPRPTSSA